MGSGAGHDGTLEPSDRRDRLVRWIRACRLEHRATQLRAQRAHLADDRPALDHPRQKGDLERDVRIRADLGLCDAAP